MHMNRGSRPTPFRALIFCFCSSALLLSCTAAQAGGGLVLENDKCIIRIDFYSAHFTAYQPASSGNEQFCKSVPDTGKTVFVLDYLHQSMKEVPVEFRLVRDFTGQGRFVKLEHLGQVEDLEQYTVFHQPPVVRPDASFVVDHDFSEEGRYLGVVTVGHPTNDQTYSAVFPFEVGTPAGSYMVPVVAALGALAALAVLWRRRSMSPSRATGSPA